MGIRGLQTFIKETSHEFKEIELHHCNVVLDGDSIYHQIYDSYNLTCVFGGEYDRFYQCCIQLFESFRKCNINTFVVFDGAQLDSRKELTMIQRAEQSILKSIGSDSKSTISPLLLRQTFVSVLDVMKIPYVSALGEGDDECVSLANHFDCYLVATDSDYFVYNLRRGYIPFQYIKPAPQRRGGITYLNAKLYHIDSLLHKFNGLKPDTLALACCLCGNDYINRDLTMEIIEYMNGKVDKRNQLHNGERLQTYCLWNAMKWMRYQNDIDAALNHLLRNISFCTRQEVRRKIEVAVRCYLEPSNKLIYRFSPLNHANPNLKKNPVFVQLAQSYFTRSRMNDNQLKSSIYEISRNIKSKCNNSLPLFLADAVTDLRLSATFIDMLIHRELFCKALIEVKDEQSVFSYAIPIVLPCFAILIKWDTQLSITIHHRRVDQLAEYRYPISINEDDNDIPELEEIWTTMPIDKRQDYVRKYLKIPEELQQRLKAIPLDFHLWLMIIHYWYTQCNVSAVHLYAILVSFIKCISLPTDHDSRLIEQLNDLLTAFNIQNPYQSIDLSEHEEIFEKFKEFVKKNSTETNFDRRVTYELSCLQAIYLYTLRLNDFFRRPFNYSIYPQDFISGSLFYSFVKYCQEEHYADNMTNSMDTLFGNKTVLVDLLHNLYNVIALINPENNMQSQMNEPDCG